MEEQVDLTQEQRLYLQFILDTFRAESQWPTHDRLDQFLYQTDPDMDIEDIRSDDILGSHPDWDVADVQKMGWLLLGEGHLWQSFSGPGSPSGWTCTLKRQIRRFSDVCSNLLYMIDGLSLQAGA